MEMNQRFSMPYSYARNRDREKMILIGVAGLAFSLVLVLLIVLGFRSANAKASLSQEVSEQIPAAVGSIGLYTSNTYIRAGTLLSQVRLSEELWPRSSIPEGALRNVNELQGYYAAVDIPPGVPLQRSHLTKEQRLITLPITPGMRAVTIEINSQSSVEGWARPGTRVDVVLTYLSGEELTSKVIVQNARVLSYGGDATSISDQYGSFGSKRVKAGSTITLEVSPGDALKIQTSRQLGSLSLLMRAPEDDKAATVTEVDRNIIDGSKPKEKPKVENCKRGRVRMEGKEFILDCDGTLLVAGE